MCRQRDVCLLVRTQSAPKVKKKEKKYKRSFKVKCRFFLQFLHLKIYTNVTCMQIPAESPLQSDFNCFFPAPTCSLGSLQLALFAANCVFFSLQGELHSEQMLCVTQVYALPLSKHARPHASTRLNCRHQPAHYNTLRQCGVQVLSKSIALWHK